METVSVCNLCEGSAIERVDAEYSFCRCQTCGYIFDSPRPSIEEIVAFYSQGAKYDSWVEAEKARDALWKRRLEKLLPYRAAGNLLDIGTGIGQFLHHARPYFTDVKGTEVSQSAVKVAKEKYGLEIRHGVVEAMDFAPESFDNITLFHVLEHVPDPTALLGTCHKLLRTGGVLAVAVPNDVLAWTSKVKKIGRKMGIEAFQKFSPVLGISKAGTSREIHLSHFTPSVLQRLFEKEGFAVVTQGIDPYYASSGVRGALEAAYYRAHEVICSVFHANRYDTIWMVGRKQNAGAGHATPSEDRSTSKV